jgi:hypothetical protein
MAAKRSKIYRNTDDIPFTPGYLVFQVHGTCDYEYPPEDRETFRVWLLARNEEEANRIARRELPGCGFDVSEETLFFNEWESRKTWQRGDAKLTVGVERELRHPDRYRAFVGKHYFMGKHQYITTIKKKEFSSRQSAIAFAKDVERGLSAGQSVDAAWSGRSARENPGAPLSTGTKVAIGAGLLALVGIGYYLYSQSSGATSASTGGGGGGGVGATTGNGGTSTILGQGGSSQALGPASGASGGGDQDTMSQLVQAAQQESTNEESAASLL